MVDFIVVIVILAILAVAIGYIIHAKKNGAKCIGCPSAGQCASHAKTSSSSSACGGGCASCGGGCACSSTENTEGAAQIDSAALASEI